MKVEVSRKKRPVIEVQRRAIEVQLKKSPKVDPKKAKYTA